MVDYEKHLLNMLQHQIVARGVNNPHILEAMQRVPRHLFASEESIETAYGDFPVSLPEDRATISQPYMVAYMTDVLQCQSSDRVLEIGTGSGYQAAILSYLCKEVYTIERYDSLRRSAERVVLSLDRVNVHFRTGDGLEGWPEEAPFHKIMVTAAMKKAPRRLLNQLCEGGMLVIPLGEPHVQMLTKITRHGSSFQTEELIQCVFVPIISRSRDMTRCDDADAAGTSTG